MTINQDAYRSVVKYIEMSRQSDIFLEIDQFVESQEKIVVWGAGSYTQRLLNTTSLRLSNIIAFIDNDSKKQGMTIEGIPIYSPIFLKDLMIPIIICSALHSDDIVSYIQRMGLSNRIVVLK
jgi:FlaA1/EpsC-like NDP-sugar epimerase